MLSQSKYSNVQSSEYKRDVASLVCIKNFVFSLLETLSLKITSDQARLLQSPGYVSSYRVVLPTFKSFFFWNHMIWFQL